MGEMSPPDLPTYILKDGKILRVDFLTWASWLENSDERIIEYTDLGPVTVSTIFTGLDHNYAGQGPAILFETAVFSRNIQILSNVPYCHVVQRYATMGQAKEGHWNLVRHLCEQHGLKVQEHGHIPD